MCAPNNDPPFMEKSSIERVKGLAGLEHDVIGDIDDVVNRSKACRNQAAREPVWRRSDRYVVDHDRHISRTKFGRIDRDERFWSDWKRRNIHGWRQMQ